MPSYRDMNVYERDAHSAVQDAHDSLQNALRLCSEVGFSDMNVVQPLRDALAAVLGVRNVIEGKV